MQKRRLWFSGLLVALIGSNNAFGLSWETTALSAEATPDQESYEAVFRFTNTSEEVVTIQSVRSSCGCTVPELSKREYAPGDTGEINAIFTFGTRTGKQHKTITVITDEVGAEDVSLSLEVLIPTLIEVKPFFVFWRKGDLVETKYIEIQVSDPGLIQPVEVETQSSTFQVELESTDDPASFRLAITPESTETSGNTHFLIKTDFPVGNPRVIRVYAGIR